MRLSPPRTPIVVAFIIAVAATAVGQGPFVHYPDDNVAPNFTTPGGWYPWFTNATGTRYQIRIPATAFASVTLPVNLTSIGFVLGTTANGLPATYSVMQFRLGPSAAPALTNTFATNLAPGTETLIADVSGSTYQPQVATGVWIDIPLTSIYPYTGGDLVLEIQSRIPTGGTYHRSSVSALVPRLTNSAYNGTQTTGTLIASNGVKVRFALAPAGPPEYQVNSVAASLLVNGIQGNVGAPATFTVPIGLAVNAIFSSTNLGFPWEIGLGPAPLVPRSGGALTTADGELVNLDVTDPSLFLFWGLFQSPPYANATLAYPTGGPSVLSVQFLIIDPIALSGVRCAQASRVTVQ